MDSGCSRASRIKDFLDGLLIWEAPCRRFRQFPLRPWNPRRSQFLRSRLGPRRFQSPVFRRRLQSPVFRSPLFRCWFRSRVFSRRFQSPMFRFQSPVFRLRPAWPRFSPFRLRPGRSQGPVLPRLPFQPWFPGTSPIRLQFPLAHRLVPDPPSPDPGTPETSSPEPGVLAPRSCPLARPPERTLLPDGRPPAHPPDCLCLEPSSGSPPPTLVDLLERLGSVP
ncbi:hypothetical protein EYF80_035489 [Liparis tanakae]|uniref:Uncharacterized protein n=1 Tax=Liparis tanakae TaxID=230148 RepID=A0A4Z2GM08_9TELE|nr:hypothetical protein EYF80_035489 [Liparis tanakae]